jgi:hypothetical protein
MKTLLIVTSVIESVIGLIFLISPPLPVLILLGLSVDSTVDLLLGRVAGAALLSVGIACWFARIDEKSGTTKGLVNAVLLYNIIVTMLLAYAGLSAHLLGAGLWPAVFVHIAMTIWCLLVLWKMRKIPLLFKADEIKNKNYE